MLPYADLDLFMKLAERRASETPHSMLTYCAACRDTFAAVGKPVAHILDLIFNPGWQGWVVRICVEVIRKEAIGVGDVGGNV